MTSEAAKAAKARYDAKTAKYISLKLNQNTDADIIQHLEKQSNVQGFLKNLIRQSMKICISDLSDKEFEELQHKANSEESDA